MSSIDRPSSVDFQTPMDTPQLHADPSPTPYNISPLLSPTPIDTNPSPSPTLTKSPHAFRVTPTMLDGQSIKVYLANHYKPLPQDSTARKPTPYPERRE